MKKSFFGIFATLSLLLTAGCNSDAENSYIGAYDAIAAGITIYNGASTQHAVSLDPAGVAIRLAMLLDEAAAKQTDIESVTISTEYQEYNLKYILFGSGVQIKAQEGSAGEYLITYNGSIPASLDTFCRQGSYRIQTGGLALGATTELTPWVITPEGSLRLYTNNGSASDRFTFRDGTTRIHALGNGSYRIALEEIAASFEGYDSFCSAWSGNWTFATSTATGDMSYSNHDSDRFTLSGSASGSTFYAFNNASTTRMSYYISNLEPLCWRPSETGSHTLAVTGEESASLTNPTDYPSELYPSPQVKVVRTYQNNKCTIRVSYNGTTMEL